MSNETPHQVPCVGLPITDKLALREVRFDVGDHAAEWVACWHAQLYILAAQGRVPGEFSTTIRAFVASYGGHVPRVGTDDHVEWLQRCVELWHAFQAHGIVELDTVPEEPSSRLRVRVVAYGETNATRSTTSDDTAAQGAPVRWLDPVLEAGRTQAAVNKAKQRHRDRLARPGTCCADPENCLVCGEVSRDSRGQSTPVAGVAGQSATRGDVSPPPPLPPSPEPPPSLAPTPPSAQRAHEAAGHSEQVAPLPPDSRTVSGVIRRAQGQIGDLTFHVNLLLSRRNQSLDQPLTKAKELEDIWRPAAELFADHGRDRLKQALSIAETENAVSMRFVRSVCKRLQQADERSRADDPDRASSDWAGFTGERATVTTQEPTR